MPHLISFNVQDFTGSIQQHVVFVPVSTYTIEQLTEFIQEYAPLLQAVCEGEVISATITLNIDTGLSSAGPGPSSSVEEGVLFNFNLTNSTYTHSTRVPAFLQSLMTASGPNGSDDDVIALVAALRDGIAVTGGTIQPCNPFEFDYSGLAGLSKSLRR